MNKRSLVNEVFGVALVQAGFDIADKAATPEVIRNAIKVAFATEGVKCSVRTKVAYVSRLRSYLKINEFTLEQIDATRVPDLTRLSNDMSTATREKKNKEAFEIPPCFTPEKIKSTLEEIIAIADVQWSVSKIACLQAAMCCRLSELFGIQMTLDTGTGRVSVRGCSKSVVDISHDLVSCVDPVLVYNAWLVWSKLDEKEKAKGASHHAYNRVLKRRYNFTSHRLRSIGAQLAVESAKCETDVQRANVRRNALRHISPLGVSITSYSDIKS